MEKAQPRCEIVYVREETGNGWKWRAIGSGAAERRSERVYGLFYECVLAARASGYAPVGVLPPSPDA